MCSFEVKEVQRFEKIRNKVFSIRGYQTMCVIGVAFSLIRGCWGWSISALYRVENPTACATEVVGCHRTVVANCYWTIYLLAHGIFKDGTDQSLK
jgi:hypothetical protein